MMVSRRPHDDLQPPPLPPPPDPGETALKLVKALGWFFGIVVAVIILIGHFGWVKDNGQWLLLAGVIGITVQTQWPRILEAIRAHKLHDAQVEHLKAKTQVLKRTITFDERGNAGVFLESAEEKKRVLQLGGNHTELPAGVQNVHHHVVTRYAPAAALKAKPEEVVDADVPLPQAPPFREMSHLISEQRMPLCYISEYGENVPAFGTIDDLLSMAVTGKPGRGKTTALMYYVCMLLKCGAEVFVFDPHGAMNEIAVLNNRPLPGMPPSARILYVDRREDMVNTVPVLQGKLDERDTLYRTRKQTLHPLLLLADELPVMADYDAQTAAEYKVINKARERAGQVALEVPLMIDLIRRFVLEARVWRCFFIGSGQSFDSEILPTRVTQNLNSRIVFFSSDQRARMSGLENDVVKELLPLIRRAGPGVMVFDCSRWEPMIGAIPSITIDDMAAFLGVQSRSSLPDLPMHPSLSGLQTTGPLSSLGQNDEDCSEKPGLRLLQPVSAVRDQSSEGEIRTSPGTVPEQLRTCPGPVTGQLRTGKDPRFTAEQSKMFAQEYRKDLLVSGKADIKTILRRMKLGNGYYKHASIIAEHVRRQNTSAREG